LAGEIYASRAITSLAMHKFAGDRKLPHGVDVLSDRELAVFALIAAEHGTGQIAKEFGVSPKTIETHSAHIKRKLGYGNEVARSMQFQIGLITGIHRAIPRPKMM
jgi:DNA-binding CsgD family transcriptional regulator